MITDAERALLRALAEDEREVVAVASEVGWTGPDCLDVAAGALRTVGHGDRPSGIASDAQAYRVLASLDHLTALLYEAVSHRRPGHDGLQEHLSTARAISGHLAHLDTEQDALDVAAQHLLLAQKAIAHAHALNARG